MITTKNNFIAITGGPGGGKTTLLQLLKEKGFDFVPETAREIIKQRLNRGLSPRPEPADFAKQIFDIDVENYERNIHESKIIFFDRTFIDSAYMIKESGQTYFEKIKPQLKNSRFNNKVFITPPWKEIYTTDTERDQTFEEAVIVYEKLFYWYKLNGYELVILPKTTVEERIQCMLDELKLNY